MSGGGRNSPGENVRGNMSRGMSGCRFDYATTVIPNSGAGIVGVAVEQW